MKMIKWNGLEDSNGKEFILEFYQLKKIRY